MPFVEKIMPHYQAHPLFGALGNPGAASDQQLIADLFWVDPWLAIGLLKQQRPLMGTLRRCAR